MIMIKNASFRKEDKKYFCLGLGDSCDAYIYVVDFLLPQKIYFFVRRDPDFRFLNWNFFLASE